MYGTGCITSVPKRSRGVYRKCPSHQDQASFERLSTVAAELNTATDELSQVIASLDEGLKKLNLGIVSWYDFAGNDDNISYWGNSIGYAKIGTKWGIALRRTAGNHEAPPEYHQSEEWLFNDAPRQLRMEAVGYIPAMVDKLISDAEAAVKKVKDKTSQAKQLADALAPAGRTAPRGQRRP